MNSPFWSLVMRYFLEFFSMVPCAVLCFLPVQDRLRQKPLNIFLTGIPLSILWAFAGGLVCADFGIARDFWILPSFILFAVFFHRVCDLALWKPFSILTAVCAVFSCITNLTLVADALIDRTNTSGLFTLPGAGIHLLLSVLIVAIGTLVTDKIVEPRLGRFEQEEGQADHRLTALTGQEAKGMKIASLVLLLLVAGLIAAAIPRASLPRNPQTGSLTTGAPLIDGIIILLALLFFVPSVLYGRISGTYKNEKDVAGQLEKNMAAMGGYIALIFVAAQFISFFNYSKLGTILAISGAEFLKSSGISGPLLMVIFVLFTSLLNLLMGSATAKWTVLAPIFIPMFMMLGYSPELTQVAYRIGDSCTNLITPLMSYFAMVVVFAKKYDRESGIGTLISTMLPYSLFFMIGWAVLLVIWMVFGLPLGPGAGLFV